MLWGLECCRALYCVGPALYCWQGLVPQPPTPLPTASPLLPGTALCAVAVKWGGGGREETGDGFTTHRLTTHGLTTNQLTTHLPAAPSHGDGGERAVTKDRGGRKRPAGRRGEERRSHC